MHVQHCSKVSYHLSSPFSRDKSHFSQVVSRFSQDASGFSQESLKRLVWHITLRKSVMCNDCCSAVRCQINGSVQHKIAAKCMCNCLVQPIFDYTHTVWDRLSIRCSNSLKALQNRAAHIIQKRAMTEEAFTMLGWVYLETRCFQEETHVFRKKCCI